MEGQNYLGVYITADSASVVCIGKHEREAKAKDSSFNVHIDGTQESPYMLLASLVKQGCIERHLQYNEVAIALDCTMYMQHNVHSEFVDEKQIISTIHFDVEEALATDVSDDGIAFNIISSKPSGSEMMVYNSKKKLLGDVITAFRANGMDPVSVEPDISSIARFLRQMVVSEQQENILFGILSSHCCYFAAKSFHQDSKVECVGLRTLLVKENHNALALLSREIPITLALCGSEINSAAILTNGDLPDIEQLKENIGIDVSVLDINQCGISDEMISSGGDKVSIAIAYGAAISHLDKIHTANFRNDFMPYLGRKMRIEKMIKTASVILILPIFLLGIYLQWSLAKANKPFNELKKALSVDYSAVMMGKKMPGKPAKDLEKEIIRIENVQSGKLSIAGEQAISVKVTSLLAAFNKCAAQTKLEIEKIIVTPKNISITGSTSDRNSTLNLIDTLKKSGLEIGQYRYDLEGGKDVFKITIQSSKREI